MLRNLLSQLEPVKSVIVSLVTVVQMVSLELNNADYVNLLVIYGEC